MTTDKKMKQWIADNAHSSIEFSVRHMGIAWVKGRFTAFEATAEFNAADPSGGNLIAKIKTDSIWTGEEKRDRHLRSADFFDVEQHPQVTFKSTGIVREDDTHYIINGDLTMHGITHSVVLSATYQGAREIPGATEQESVLRSGFNAQATVNRHDFKISWDAPAGEGATTVGGEVDIDINVEFIAQ